MSFVKARPVTITSCLWRQTRYTSSQPSTSEALRSPIPHTSSSIPKPHTAPKSTETLTSGINDGAPTKPTHFKITLHRSAIGLPKRYKDTLESLGIRRRGQTVFHAHSGASAGKILRVKELVKVENVTEDEVKTSAEMRNERKAVRGYVIKQRFKDEAGSSRTWMDGL